MIPFSHDEERPRERLWRFGVETLSDADLVALLLRTGQRGASASELARRVLERHAGAAALARASASEIAAIPGIGLARAATITAALALGRRVDALPLVRGQPVISAEQVFRHFAHRLGGLCQERFYVLLLDGRGRIQDEVRISEGTLTASLVHPREVFRRAVREAAASVILVHNHPSGDPTPSSEDEALTTRLRAAGDVVGIRVLDHVVLGAGRWVSFAETARL